jgi:hypothetical protein
MQTANLNKKGPNSYLTNLLNVIFVLIGTVWYQYGTFGYAGTVRTQFKHKYTSGIKVWICI